MPKHSTCEILAHDNNQPLKTLIDLCAFTLKSFDIILLKFGAVCMLILLVLSNPSVIYLHSVYFLVIQTFYDFQFIEY